MLIFDHLPTFSATSTTADVKRILDANEKEVSTEFLGITGRLHFEILPEVNVNSSTPGMPDGMSLAPLGEQFVIKVTALTSISVVSDNTGVDFESQRLPLLRLLFGLAEEEDLDQSFIQSASETDDRGQATKRQRNQNRIRPQCFPGGFWSLSMARTAVGPWIGS